MSSDQDDSVESIEEVEVIQCSLFEFAVRAHSLHNRFLQSMVSSNDDRASSPSDSSLASSDPNRSSVPHTNSDGDGAESESEIDSESNSQHSKSHIPALNPNFTHPRARSDSDSSSGSRPSGDPHANDSTASSPNPSPSCSSDSLGSVSEDEQLDALVEYLEFGIAGIQRKENKRYSINNSGNYLSTDWWVKHRERTQHRMDVDSLIGRDRVIPWTSAIQVFPLFSKGFLIERSLHIGYSPYVTMLDVEEFQIPHLVIAVPNEHGSTIHLMLPGLCDKENPANRRPISPNIRSKIYSLLRKAALASAGTIEDGHWLPTYEAELKRARNRKGHIMTTGKLIPARAVKRFGQKLLRYIWQEPWGDDAYYLHEIRGVRASNQHSERRHADRLMEFLSVIDLEMINQRTWYLDIGHEVQAESHVLWWRRDSHAWLIQRLLGLRSQQAALNIMNSKQDLYQVDLACHIFDIAGFRLTLPRKISQASGIYYIQAYCTEKQAAYRAGGESLQLSYHALFQKTEELAKYADSLARIFHAFEENKTAGNARLEIRVRLDRVRKHGHPSYINLHGDNATRCFFQFDSSQYWSFKRARVMCIAQCITSWQVASLEAKCHAQAIALAVSLVYMINALNSRPKEYQAEASMFKTLTAGCYEPVFEEEDEDDESSSRSNSDSNDGGSRHVGQVHMFNILFPSDMRGWTLEIPCPHLGKSLTFDDMIYRRLFGKNICLIQAALLPSPDVEFEQRTNRVTTRGPRRNLPHPGPVDEEDVLTVDEAQLILHPVINANQSSQEEMVQAFISQASICLSRFYMDILMRAPNEGAGAQGQPYLRMGHSQRLKASARDFQTQNLAILWRRCIIRIGRQESWDAAFNFLFPMEEIYPLAKKQGYNQCEYYRQWKDVMKALEPRSRMVVRDAVKHRIDQLLWLPWTRCDRIWMSTAMTAKALSDKRSCKFFPDDSEKQTGPVIITNPRYPFDEENGCYFDAEEIE